MAKITHLCNTERHGSSVVSPPAWPKPSFGVQSSARTSQCYNLDVKTWISKLETVSLVGRGSSVIGALLRNFSKFVYPTLHVYYFG